MDIFEIEKDITDIIKQYFDITRGTGRTTKLLDTVKDGDRVIFVNRTQAMMFENLCKPRGLQVKCIDISPEIDNLVSIVHYPNLRGLRTGKTYFDHVWLEMHYKHKIKQTAAAIDEAQAYLSWDDSDSKIIL